MTDQRQDAILAARRVLRTLKSSPDVTRDARALHGVLVGATDWSFRERHEIEQLRKSLDGRQPDRALQRRCEELLELLAARGR